MTVGHGAKFLYINSTLRASVFLALVWKVTPLSNLAQVSWTPSYVFVGSTSGWSYPSKTEKDRELYLSIFKILFI